MNGWMITSDRELLGQLLDMVGVVQSERDDRTGLERRQPDDCVFRQHAAIGQPQTGRVLGRGVDRAQVELTRLRHRAGVEGGDLVRVQVRRTGEPGGVYVFTHAHV